MGWRDWKTLQKSEVQRKLTCGVGLQIAIFGKRDVESKS